MKCFYCGNDDTILLARRYYHRQRDNSMQPVKDLSELHGKSDPRNPCNECRGYMMQGIMICEIRDGEKGDNPYRTGKLWVLKQEACERMFPGHDFNKSRFIFLEESIAERIGLHNAETL